MPPGVQLVVRRTHYATRTCRAAHAAHYACYPVAYAHCWPLPCLQRLYLLRRFTTNLVVRGFPTRALFLPAIRTTISAATLPPLRSRHFISRITFHSYQPDGLNGTCRMPGLFVTPFLPIAARACAHIHPYHTHLHLRARMVEPVVVLCLLW